MNAAMLKGDATPKLSIKDANKVALGIEIETVFVGFDTEAVMHTGRIDQHLTHALSSIGPSSAHVMTPGCSVAVCGDGERLEETGEYKAALDRALASDGPALNHMLSSSEVMPPVSNEVLAPTVQVATA